MTSLSDARGGDLAFERCLASGCGGEGVGETIGNCGLCTCSAIVHALDADNRRQPGFIPSFFSNEFTIAAFEGSLIS